jgi:hypothetical protein
MAALALASCATRVPLREGTDAVCLLPQEATVYVRVGNGLLSEAAAVLLNPKDLRSAKAILDRTDRATAAFVLPAPGDGDAAIYGIAEGNYPAGAATFRLRLSREWHKEGRTLVNHDGKVQIAFAGRQILAAGNRDIEPILDSLKDPGPNPIPEDLRPLWLADGALWLARPAALLSRWMGEEAPDIPAQALCLSFSRIEGPGTGVYRGTELFQFPDERSVRVFGPLCRLAHLAFLRAVYGEDSAGADAALEATMWETSGNRVLASGFTVRSSDLFRMMGRKIASESPE